MDVGSRPFGLVIFALTVAALPALGAQAGSSGRGAETGFGAAASPDNHADKKPAGDAPDRKGLPPRQREAQQGKDAQGHPTETPDASTGPDASGYRPGNKQQNDTAPVVKHSGHVDF